MLKKFILTIFTCLVLCLLVITPVLAADLDVSCDTDGCGSTGDSPLFSETNILPGWEKTKTVEAFNNYAEARTFAIKTVNYRNADLLGDVLTITIQESGSAINLYQNNLTNLVNQGYLLLTDVSSGGSQIYDITIEMPGWVGNDYQNLETLFDLNLGFETVETITPTATPTPSDGGTDGGGGDGADGGCTAEAPSEAPDLSATAGVNTVTLTWTAVSPVTHYAIRYGVNPGEYVYGASNVGNVTSYVVSGLSAGTTYYFQVMGVNDCAPGSWSNEASATPTGTVLGVTTGGLPPAATGFTEEVLGESTPSAETPGLVEGLTATGCELDPSLWWLVLVIQLIVSIAFGRWAKNKNRKGLWPIVLALGVVSQLVHWFLMPCNCADHWLCTYYWLLNIAVALVSLVYLFLEAEPEV